ncbi:hypothetical protein [Bacillus coahuilensis]|nr:hypothetical protein [Bacillus coahuilensis]
MYNHPYNQKVQRELELWERRVTKNLLPLKEVALPYKNSGKAYP